MKQSTFQIISYISLASFVMMAFLPPTLNQQPLQIDMSQLCNSSATWSMLCKGLSNLNISLPYLYYVCDTSEQKSPGPNEAVQLVKVDKFFQTTGRKIDSSALDVMCVLIDGLKLMSNFSSSPLQNATISNASNPTPQNSTTGVNLDQAKLGNNSVVQQTVHVSASTINSTSLKSGENATLTPITVDKTNDTKANDTKNDTQNSAQNGNTTAVLQPVVPVSNSNSSAPNSTKSDLDQKQPDQQGTAGNGTLTTGGGNKTEGNKTEIPTKKPRNLHVVPDFGKHDSSKHSSSPTFIINFVGIVCLIAFCFHVNRNKVSIFFTTITEMIWRLVPYQRLASTNDQQYPMGHTNNAPHQGLD